MIKNLLFLLGTFVLIVTFATFDSDQGQVQCKMTAHNREKCHSVNEGSISPNSDN